MVDSMHDRSSAGSLRRPRLMHGACSLMALVAIGLAVAPSAWAQPGLNSPFGADEDREELRARREAHAPRIENALRQAQAVREANPELAIDIIQSIFDAPEDSYFVTPAGISLKDAAESLLLENRDQLLVPYERRFEPAAAGLLETARKQGTLEGLRDVARRYALTASGRQALFELAMASCDSGDAASTLRLVSRLRRRPAASEAFEPRLSLLELWGLRELGSPNLDAAIARIRTQFPDGLVLEGQRLPWFEGPEGLKPWLARLLPSPGEREPQSGVAQWRYKHGDARRNAAVLEAIPFLDDAWKAPLADRYDDLRKYDDPWNDADIKLVMSAATDVENRFRASGTHPLPVASPLVVNDLVISAGYGSVKAFSLKTGELAWSSLPVDETLAALLAGTDAFLQRPKGDLLKQFAAQRAYRDHVDASLSSDGKRVYRVGHSGLIGLLPYAAGLSGSPRGVSPLLPRNYNQLQAYDLNGGLCLWSIGGPPRRINAVFDAPAEELDLEGAFFCMAPLPWENQLICLVEHSRQLRIVALDPEKNPEQSPPLWSQSLLNSDNDLIYSPDRRFAGVTVAIEGSTLIAALGNGTIAAFDLADRHWLWMQTYSDPDRVDYRRAIALPRMSRPANDYTEISTILQPKEWTDPRVIVSGSKVIVTPADDGRLHCIDRATGEGLWTRPRDQALYLAGVHEGIVLLVGKSDVRGLSLEDGSTKWTSPIPPPSGRGVRIDSRYVLPLSTGEVLTLEISTGAPLARSPLASGRPAGNLVAAQGTFVTQTATEVRAFRSISEVERTMQQQLARSETDPEGLALRGELRLHRGEIEAGEKDLRSIPEPGARVSRLLAWALVNGLEREFDRYFDNSLNLEALPSDPALRMQAWTAVSRGLEKRSDLPGAVYAAIRAGENVSPIEDRLVDRDGSLRVREYALARGRVDDLWASMSIEQRADAIARIRTRLGELKPGSPEAFRLCELLAGDVLPDDLELDHLERRTVSVPILEQRLLSLRQSPDPVIAARASLLLLRLTAQDPRIPVSLDLTADLTGRLKDVSVPEGRIAGEITAELIAQPEFAKRLQESRGIGSDWVASILDQPAALNDQLNVLNEFGPVSPLLQGWTFSSEQNGSIVVSDSRGMPRMKESFIRGFGGQFNRVSTCGRLAMVETLEGFRVLDVFAQTTIQREDLLNDSSEALMAGNIRIGGITPRVRGFSRLLAPLQPEFLAFVKNSRLVVKDTLRDRELWSRAIENATDISADPRLICVQDSTGKVHVYRAVDGKLIRSGPLPNGDILAEYRADSRKLLRSIDGGELVLRLWDPATDADVWTKRFPAGTLLDVHDAREVVALSPSGEIVLLNGRDGMVVCSVKNDGLDETERVEVFGDARRLFVMAVQRNIGADLIMSLPQSVTRPVTARIITIDRSSGTTLWQRDFERLLFDGRQPGDWPVLALVAAGPQDEAAEDPARNQNSWVMLVDRNSGKTVQSAELERSVSPLRSWKYEPATKTLLIRISGITMQLTPPQAAPNEEQPEPKPPEKPVPKPVDDSPPPPPAKTPE